MQTRIKKYIKISSLFVFNSVYGFCVFYIYPTLLLIAFNRAKGAVNNPNGKMFMPVAWLIIVLIPVLFFLINMKIIKRFSLSKKFWLLSLVALIVGAIFGILLTNANYYTNYSNILEELLKKRQPL